MGKERLVVWMSDKLLRDGSGFVFAYTLFCSVDKEMLVMKSDMPGQITFLRKDFVAV